MHIKRNLALFALSVGSGVGITFCLNRVPYYYVKEAVYSPYNELNKRIDFNKQKDVEFIYTSKDLVRFMKDVSFGALRFLFVPLLYPSFSKYYEDRIKQDVLMECLQEIHKCKATLNIHLNESQNTIYLKHDDIKRIEKEIDSLKLEIFKTNRVKAAKFIQGSKSEDLSDFRKAELQYPYVLSISEYLDRRGKAAYNRSLSLSEKIYLINDKFTDEVEKKALNFVIGQPKFDVLGNDIGLKMLNVSEITNGQEKLRERRSQDELIKSKFKSGSYSMNFMQAINKHNQESNVKEE